MDTAKKYTLTQGAAQWLVDKIKDADDGVKELENHTRVNLLRSTLGTTTINGVTCTNNGDGTYTLNGTATGNASFFLCYIILDTSKYYKFVGCPQGGSTNTFCFAGANFKDYGDGSVCKPNRESVDATIIIYSGYTCDNLIFRPMLTTDLTATYDDFVSYEDSLAISGLKAEKKWTMVLKGTLSNPGIEYNTPSIYEEFMVQLGTVNGGQIFGGTNVVIPKGSNHPMFIPLYVNSDLYAVAYIFLNPENNVLDIDSSATINYEVWAR